jgi:predicted transcriptional regulator of viral defense system
MSALTAVRRLGEPVIRTADLMASLHVQRAHASQILARLSMHGHVVRLKRGLWALAEATDPLVLVPHVTAPLPSYVSLQTALYHHGMISQIPQVVYAVSLARTRQYDTPLAVISVHHVPASFFFGFEEIGERHVRMAVPEKALVDVLYLSPARSRLFAALPELELPARFSVRKASTMIGRIEDARRRSMVETRLWQLLPSARRAQRGQS